MVLWEITLATAYFLGLKRTYKLALKIQKKIISAKHPKIRQFVQRRTRNVFDVALKVHYKIQERDIEVGRNLGNWILRWLDKLKPDAQIRGPPISHTNADAKFPKQYNNSTQLSNHSGFSKHNATHKDKGSDKVLFTAAAQSLWSRPFPTINVMMRPRTARYTIKYRQFGSGAEFFTVRHIRLGSGEVIRNDIRQWIQHQ